MNRKALVALFAAGMALSVASQTYGHHSFAATYYVDRTIHIEGTVSQFLYRNPHSFLKIEAVDEKGEMQTWSIEWGGGTQLSESNVNKDTLKPGDHVIVEGNPGRDTAEHRIRMHSIVRPSDGWKWEGTIR